MQYINIECMKNMVWSPILSAIKCLIRSTWEKPLISKLRQVANCSIWFYEFVPFVLITTHPNFVKIFFPFQNRMQRRVLFTIKDLGFRFSGSLAIILRSQRSSRPIGKLKIKNLRRPQEPLQWKFSILTDTLIITGPSTHPLQNLNALKSDFRNLSINEIYKDFLVWLNISSSYILDLCFEQWRKSLYVLKSSLNKLVVALIILW